MLPTDTSVPLQAACHCGTVRYEATTNLETVISCNCSHCSKRGLLPTFVTPDRFRLLSGEDALEDYQVDMLPVAAEEAR